jgi:hypothetical protein
MNLNERIESFTELGEILRKTLAGNTGPYSAGLNRLIEAQYLKNEWFTPENVRLALNNIAAELTYGNLVKWCSFYPDLKNRHNPVNAGVVMAGNIPLAGFHDFLSILISGNNVIAKTSSKDSQLISFIADIMISLNPAFRKSISLTTDSLAGFDVVIATGSDNSSRYFEYYFGKYPRIIRKNRNSIAIIEGNETSEELEALGLDVFSYFGLGCRNVSKIFLPQGYQSARLAESWNSYSGILAHKKYANNYDYNKAVCLVNKDEFHDTGYALLKRDEGLASPVSVIYYDYYESEKDISDIVQLLGEKLQCTTGRKFIPFGKAQSPQLWDYADGIDTIDFLLKKNNAGIS